MPNQRPALFLSKSCVTPTVCEPSADEAGIVSLVLKTYFTPPSSTPKKYCEPLPPGIYTLLSVIVMLSLLT